MKRALFILGRAGGRKTEDAAALKRPAFRRRRRPPYFAFCGRHGPPAPEAAYRPRACLPGRVRQNMRPACEQHPDRAAHDSQRAGRWSPAACGMPENSGKMNAGPAAARTRSRALRARNFLLSLPRYFSSTKKRLYQTRNVNTVQILRWLLARSWKWSSSSFISASGLKNTAA